MPDETEEQFLVEGIGRYAQALETIQSFQTMLGDRLCQVLKAHSCDVFSPTKAPTAGTSEGAFGHIIWANKKGLLQSREDPIWLETGVWWKDGEVACYSGFADAANKAIEFKYLRDHPRVEFRKWSKKARLFMAVSPASIRLDDDVKTVLDELAASFK